jgi:hypothetical protein
VEWTSAAFGFLSAIGLAVITAIVTADVERRSARRARVEDARFQIYMKLLDLYNLYFWVASKEIHGEEVRPEMKDQIRAVSWQINDQLRAADEVEHMPEILNVVLSTHFESAADRHRAIDEVVKKLGETVNPRYAEAVRQISEGNLLRLAAGKRGSDTTPGLMS